MNGEDETKRNPITGACWLDEDINRRAREKGQGRDIRRPIGASDGDYSLFDREKFIANCLEAGKPIVITWIPSSMRLECRDYEDIHGVSDIFGIEEIPSLFSGIKEMKSFRIFLIPYLITGYGIPPELERDEEPLVPFTAKTIEMLKEIST